MYPFFLTYNNNRYLPFPPIFFMLWGIKRYCTPYQKSMPTTTPIKKERAQNPWLVHVAKYRTAHPDASYKEALKESAKTYSKISNTPPTVRTTQEVGDAQP